MNLTQLYLDLKRENVIGKIKILNLYLILCRNNRNRDEGTWIAVGQKKTGVEMKPKKSKF